MAGAPHLVPPLPQVDGQRRLAAARHAQDEQVRLLPVLGVRAVVHLAGVLLHVRQGAARQSRQFVICYGVRRVRVVALILRVNCCVLCEAEGSMADGWVWDLMRCGLWGWLCKPCGYTPACPAERSTATRRHEVRCGLERVGGYQP